MSIRAPNFPSFKGVPSSPPWILGGIFTLCSLTSIFKAANPPQDLSVSKSFECSIWILNIILMSSYNCQKCSDFDVDTALLRTLWTQMLGYKRTINCKCYWNHLVRLSVHPSVHLSFCPCVWVCPDSISWTARPFLTKLGMMVYYHEMVCHAEKLDHCLNVKVTVRAYIIKNGLSLLYLLNCWSVCNQTWFDSTAS